MTDLFAKLISPQGHDIYQLLQKKEPMTAKTIGELLGIFPHAVYRASKPLLELGLIKKTEGYPVKFVVTNAANLPISFIYNRTDLLKKTNYDITKAKKEVRIIVSGLEVPAETIFVFKQAIEKGIIIKIIVQRLDEVSKKMFVNWRKIGLNVRFFPNMEARIFVIDSQIVYFTSYNPHAKEESIGVRFEYTPFAKLMNELFERRWEKAQEV